MKKCLLILFALLFHFNLQSQNMDVNNDKLAIIWTSDNPELAHSMVLMYAYNAKKNNWFNDVTLIIWGPSAKMVAYNEEIQEKLKKMKTEGVKIEACIACAKMLGVDEKLKQLGYDVKGMGVPLSNYLKQNYKVLSF